MAILINGTRSFGDLDQDSRFYEYVNTRERWGSANKTYGCRSTAEKIIEFLMATRNKLGEDSTSGPDTEGERADVDKEEFFGQPRQRGHQPEMRRRTRQPRRF